MRYLGLLLFMLLAACGPSLGTPTPAPIPTAARFPTPTLAAAAAAVPQRLQGTGKQAPTLSLTAGLATFRMTHAGQANFIVELLDPGATLVELLANEIGRYDGGIAVRVPSSGRYTLNVSADAAWTIEALQPGSAEHARAVSLPRTFSGTSHAYSDLFNASAGGLRLTMQHSGEENFIVQVLDAQGRMVDLAANEIGPFQGSKVVRIPTRGVYLLNVAAGGSWSVEASQ